MKLKLNKLLFILAFSPIFGAEPQKESSKQEALDVCKDIALVGATEAEAFGKSIFWEFCKENYKEYFQKPLFKEAGKIVESYVGKPDKITIKQQTVAGVTLATLYVLYKWFTQEKGKDSKETVNIDIRPKTYAGFVLLLSEKDAGLSLMSKFRYELDSIKKDLELKDKSGLELLSSLYPNLIIELEPSQRQYLNDLVKQVTGTDTIVVVPAKVEPKPAIS